MTFKPQISSLEGKQSACKTQPATPQAWSAKDLVNSLQGLLPDRLGLMIVLSDIFRTYAQSLANDCLSCISSRIAPKV